MPPLPYVSDQSFSLNGLQHACSASQKVGHLCIIEHRSWVYPNIFLGGAKPVCVYNAQSNLVGNNAVHAWVNLCTLRASLPNDDTAEDCGVCVLTRKLSESPDLRSQPHCVWVFWISMSCCALFSSTPESERERMCACLLVFVYSHT